MKLNFRLSVVTLADISNQHFISSLSSVSTHFLKKSVLQSFYRRVYVPFNRIFLGHSIQTIIVINFFHFFNFNLLQSDSTMHSEFRLTNMATLAPTLKGDLIFGLLSVEVTYVL